MEYVGSRNISLEYDKNVYIHEKIKSELTDNLIAKNIVPQYVTKINKDDHILSSSEYDQGTIKTTTTESVKNDIICSYEIEPGYDEKKENEIPWETIRVMTNKSISYDEETESVNISCSRTVFRVSITNLLKSWRIFSYVLGMFILTATGIFYLIESNQDMKALIIPGTGLFFLILGIILHIKYNSNNYQQNKAESLRKALADMALTFYEVIVNLELLDHIYLHKDFKLNDITPSDDFSVPLSTLSKEEFVQKMVYALDDKVFLNERELGWEFSIQ